MSDGTRVMWMRGGTSKGGYFLKQDLPVDAADRDALLLRALGSPDLRQIDGMGGGDPLASKVAVVSPAMRPGIDVDYLFLQVAVDQPVVSADQNCGNILAGVAPFAIERGLVQASDGETSVAIHMVNTGQTAVATVRTPGGRVDYQGNARIDGVPGTAAPITLAFRDIAGSTCGALLPTGQPVDIVDGVPLTLIDNGMPCVIMRASDVGASGYETREELDSAVALKARLEQLRLAVGERMNLADVTDKPVPKMVLVAPPRHGGTITVRCFIPHRAHASVGVFAAISVATACLTEGSPAAQVAEVGQGSRLTLSIEHPTGETACVVDLGPAGRIASTAILRTARKLMDGTIFA